MCFGVAQASCKGKARATNLCLSESLLVSLSESGFLL